MNNHETFGQCLQRVLSESGVSASEAARMVNFRSRNSIFRILADDTSCDVDARFLEKLHAAVGDAWPQRHWDALYDALEIKRVGFEQYISNKVFYQALYAPEEEKTFLVAENEKERPLQGLLQSLVTGERMEIIMTGSCDASLARLLVKCCARAGDEGRLSIRHYLDADQNMVVRNFMGVLPLVSKSWYNARLVDHRTCPPEMLAIYRVQSIILRQLEKDKLVHQLVRYDDTHFLYRKGDDVAEPLVPMLDRWRYHLEILKPDTTFEREEEAFIKYTSSFEWLERDCTILSIKPDAHFNCIPCDVLRPAILEGFQAAGIADGAALKELVTQLEAIHEARVNNMMKKRSATHLVYSFPAMAQFMETGVLTDQFFIQRAYTVGERREIIAMLRDTMLKNPGFNVHFLREDSPALCNEITLYKGKGVLLLDAYSGYALNDDHSEAIITQPAFMDRFYRFYMDELLQKHVVSRAESLAKLEKLLRMG